MEHATLVSKHKPKSAKELFTLEQRRLLRTHKTHNHATATARATASTGSVHDAAGAEQDMLLLIESRWNNLSVQDRRHYEELSAQNSDNFGSQSTQNTVSSTSSRTRSVSKSKPLSLDTQIIGGNTTVHSPASSAKTFQSSTHSRSALDALHPLDDTKSASATASSSSSSAVPVSGGYVGLHDGEIRLAPTSNPTTPAAVPMTPKIESIVSHGDVVASVDASAHLRSHSQSSNHSDSAQQPLPPGHGDIIATLSATPSAVTENKDGIDWPWSSLSVRMAWASDILFDMHRGAIKQSATIAEQTVSPPTVIFEPLIPPEPSNLYLANICGHFLSITVIVTLLAFGHEFGWLLVFPLAFGIPFFMPNSFAQLLASQHTCLRIQQRLQVQINRRDDVLVVVRTVPQFGDTSLKRFAPSVHALASFYHAAYAYLTWLLFIVEGGSSAYGCMGLLCLVYSVLGHRAASHTINQVTCRRGDEYEFVNIMDEMDLDGYAEAQLEKHRDRHRRRASQHRVGAFRTRSHPEPRSLFNANDGYQSVKAHQSDGEEEQEEDDHGGVFRSSAGSSGAQRQQQSWKHKSSGMHCDSDGDDLDGNDAQQRDVVVDVDVQKRSLREKIEHLQQQRFITLEDWWKYFGYYDLKRHHMQSQRRGSVNSSRSQSRRSNSASDNNDSHDVEHKDAEHGVCLEALGPGRHWISTYSLDTIRLNPNCLKLTSSLAGQQLQCTLEFSDYQFANFIPPSMMLNPRRRSSLWPCPVVSLSSQFSYHFFAVEEEFRQLQLCMQMPPPNADESIVDGDHDMDMKENHGDDDDAFDALNLGSGGTATDIKMDVLGFDNDPIISSMLDEYENESD
jgi:hypothetical protein